MATKSDPFLVRQLERSKLDKQLVSLRAAQRRDAFRRPRRGWVRALRDALGMNGRQLAERMGIARSHLSQIEAAELRGAASMQTLERAAAALGCDLVYAFVPRDGKTLEAMLSDRAREVASAIVRRVGTSMALESQGVIDEGTLEKEVARVASELTRTRQRALWDR